MCMPLLGNTSETVHVLNLSTSRKCIGEGRNTSTYPQHRMKLSDEFHGPATVPQDKEVDTG
jgi:hypothetical protein